MVNRRSFLLAGASPLLSGIAMNATAAGDSSIALWPAAAPGGGGPAGDEHVSSRGAVSNIAQPSLRVFLPSTPNGHAVLVAAGGGYQRIEIQHEAMPAARWLAARGITAFVLAYRLPAEGWQAGPLAPLQDAQRAIRLIRANAGRYGIDASRVGVLGFSAGGHLMGMAAARSAFASYAAVDDADRHSARPAHAALIYPVITIQAPYDGTATRKILLGHHPSASASAQWSVETHVKADCSPMFLTQAADDPISDPRNTVIMQQACLDAGVPVVLHPLGSGGHGFGMGSAGSPTAQWPVWYQAWLSDRGMLG